MTECVLAIDIGTQQTRAALVAPDGSLLDWAGSGIDLCAPSPGWAEQDPEVWWSTTVANILTLTGRHPDASVAAVAVGAQMHSVVPLDATGNPLASRVGIWSDKRAAAQVAQFATRPDAARLSGLAANVPLPAWVGFKMAWCRVEQPDLYERAKTFLVAKDFLNLRLCGEVATDPSEASGTFLVDAATGEWSPELVDALGLDVRLLPPIVGSASVVGRVLPEVSNATGIRSGTPVVTGGGDMLCQLLAVGLTRPGRLAEVAGTGSIVAAYGAEACPDPRVMSLRTVTGGWANFGIGDGAGSCLRWLADLLPAGAASVSGAPAHSYASIDEDAAAVPAGSEGLLFFPYLLGERTLGSAASRASFIGVTLRHDAAHMARAVLEGICFENRRALDLLTPTGDGTVLRCTGGGSRSALWNQIRANVYGRPVRSLTTTEGGIQGAALLAGVGAGWYVDAAEAAEGQIALGPVWQPRPEDGETYRAGYATFCAVHDALARHWDHWCR
jgi:xylulokinase